MGVLASHSMMTFLESQNWAGRAEFGQVIAEQKLTQTSSSPDSFFGLVLRTLKPCM
jgi:hypothetical protein